jgi:hypothetical protein
MRKVIAILVCAVGVAGIAAIAEAKGFHFRSQHPLPRKIAHGFCYIEVPHVHNFEPGDRRLYREIDGQFYFVGDPAPFNYEGPRYSFYGAHPVVEAHVQVGQPVYCHMNGPHYHWYQPQRDAAFEFRGGAYWYVGNYEPYYFQERPRYVVVNEAYRPIVYTRPIVDVTVAPPGFRGEIVAVGPGMRGRAHVGGPAVTAGVYVAAPPPPTVHVGVGVNFGGPAVVERREVYVRDRHDNGRHRGWYKDKHKHKGDHDGGWRGNRAPPPSGGWRGNAAPPPSGGWRGNGAPPPSGGWRGNAPAQPSGGLRGSPPPAPRQERHNDRKDKKHDSGGGWRR